MMKHDTRRTSVLYMDTHNRESFHPPTTPKVSQDFSFVSHSGLENSIIAPAMHILKKLSGRLFLVSTAVQKCPVSPKETYLFFSLFSLSHKTHNNVT